MKRLSFLVSLSLTVLLCSAAPALETLTCTQDAVAAAARLAMRDINKNHQHGYKFRLNETQGNNIKKVGENCNIELQLELLETKCHVVNPKNFEDCPLREKHSREVKANCNVTITLKDGDASPAKYACDTRQVKTNTEMVSICPDCVTLLPLNDTEGLNSVNEAVKKFNVNTTNKHYYVLKEVGRISSALVMTTGMNYYTEFALVETQCPLGSRIIPEACVPLCPDRAQHAFCKSSFSSTNGLQSTECEFYPPVNTTELAPGEKEPVCRHPHHHHHRHHHHGPPPHTHDHGHGPPPHAHKKDQGPPSQGRNHGHGPPTHAHNKDQKPPSQGRDHGHGPPPHAHNKDQGPPSQGRNHGTGPPHGEKKGHHHKFFQPCHGFLVHVDTALHPICPWPFPEHHKPKPSNP